MSSKLTNFGKQVIMNDSQSLLLANVKLIAI